MKLNRFKALFSVLILWSLLVNSLPVMAQGDIVTSEDIGGSSVFVFRKSSKAPQAKFAPKSKPTRNKAEKADTRNAFKEQAKKVSAERQKVVASNKPKPTPKPTPKPSPGSKPKPTPKPTPDTTTTTPQDASNDMGAGAEVYLERGEVDKSIKLFKDALEMYPANKLAKGGLSDALTRKADNVFDTDGADYSIQYYQEALKYNENNALALAGLGAAYEYLNDDNKAFDYYQKAVAINPNLTELYSPLGIGYYQRGEIDKADELLSKAVANRSNDYQTQFLLGLVNYKKNRDAQAEMALKEAVKLKPDLAEGFYYLGEIYDRNNRSNEAFDQYNKAVSANPNYGDAWFDLGVAYYNRERYQDAINAYNKAIQFNNSNWEAHANLADTYRLIGYNIVSKSKEDEKSKYDWYSKAEGSYRTATDLAENNPKAKEDRTAMAEVYSKYGFVLGRLGKWNSSINALNKALSYNPDSFDYTNLGWAYYNAAQADTRNKQTDQAKTKLESGKDALQKAIAMDPNSRAAYMNLGITLSDMGDYNGAIEALKKCLTFKDDWFNALNELGLAYRGAGNMADAVKNFTRASEVAEKSLSNVKNDFDRFVLTQNATSGLYNLAVTEIDRGNEKEARKAQDRLRKYNPNMANAVEALILTKLKNKVVNKIQQNNPLNKIPRIPY